jgi:predicted nucleic acid-binding protein
VIRAVLDANSIASGAAGFRLGTRPPAIILRAWRQQRYELVISDPLIAEVRRTLSKPYFLARVEPDVHTATLRAIAELATRVVITAVVSGVASHPEDDLVLAAAVSAGADYLVTGDKQLQRLGRYQGVVIVSPRDFLTLLEQQDDEAASSDQAAR